MRTELSEIAAHHASWLAIAQRTVATNIANASRPGHGASVTVPFAQFTDHAARDGVRVASSTGAVMPSGNTVDLAGEMIRGSEIARGGSLNAAVTGAFHRMFLAGLGS